jgi:hypothetical protein
VLFVLLRIPGVIGSGSRRFPLVLVVAIVGALSKICETELGSAAGIGVPTI